MNREMIKSDYECAIEPGYMSGFGTVLKQKLCLALCQKGVIHHSDALTGFMPNN